MTSTLVCKVSVNSVSELIINVLKQVLIMCLGTFWVLMYVILKYILKMYLVLDTQVHFEKILST